MPMPAGLGHWCVAPCSAVAVEAEAIDVLQVPSTVFLEDGGLGGGCSDSGDPCVAAKAADEISCGSSVSTQAAAKRTPSRDGGASQGSAGSPRPEGAELDGRTADGTPRLEGAALRRSLASRRRAELHRAARLRKLRCILAAGGFRSVNEPRRLSFGRGMTYPLHASVRAADGEAVAALLWAGSDRSNRDGQNLTALELAAALNRRGSHDEVLRILSA